MGQDACGAYRKFDVAQNIPVLDCDGEESVEPGTFSVKIMIEGPDSFVWCKTYWYTFHINFLHNKHTANFIAGRWKKVIKRYASFYDTGVNNPTDVICNTGVKDNGMPSNQNVMPKPNVIYCSFQTRNTIFLCFNDYYKFHNNKSIWVSFDALYCVHQTFSSNQYTACHRVNKQLL